MMAIIEAAFATSHASALMDPQEWEPFVAKIRSIYGEWYGEIPPEPEQVAAETSAPVGTVKARLSRGRAALAKSLSEYQLTQKEESHGRL